MFLVFLIVDIAHLILLGFVWIVAGSFILWATPMDLHVWLVLIIVKVAMN